MNSHSSGNGSFTLAKPWILPVVILTGLASAWAAPWTFGDSSAFRVFSVLAPLILQSILSAVTAVLAFLGKKIWFNLLIATFIISVLNGLGFLLGLWGVKLPTTQGIVLVLTSLSIVPTFIWGRKQVNYQIDSDIPTWNAENSHNDW